jgi:hypothetical protein
MWSRAAIAIAAPLSIAALTRPSLILPAVSLSCVAAATGVALFAWCTHARRNAATITSWDVAGALALIGFAAAMLSKPENVIHAFAGAPAG